MGFWVPAKAPLFERRPDFFPILSVLLLRKSALFEGRPDFFPILIARLILYFSFLSLQQKAQVPA
jgi:hypothetical protein